MLAADKSSLEAELTQQIATLQTKELQALQRNFHNLALTCAVLIGFGFSGLGLFLDDELLNNWKVLRCVGTPMGFDYSGDPMPSHSECVRSVGEALIDAFWALCCALALSFNFLALFISTVTSITGPALALRGPEGSLGVALVHMEQQMKRALKFFGRALAAFSLTIIGFGAQAVAALGFVKGAVILGVGMWTMYAVVYYGVDIGTKFHLAIGRAVRAEFDDAAAAAASDTPQDGGTVPNAPQEHFVRARDEHRLKVPWRLRLLPWRRTHGHADLVASKAAQPLWRLDEIAVLPYHQLQMARDNHGRPMPRDQVAGLISRMQGQTSAAGTSVVAGAFGASSSPAAEPELGAVQWLQHVAQAAFPAESSRVGVEPPSPWWWPFAPTNNSATVVPHQRPRPSERGMQLHELEAEAV